MKLHFPKIKGRTSKTKPSRIFSLGKDPYQDWRILILVSFIILILIITLGAYIFVGVRKGDLFLVPVAKELQPKTLDQAFISEILSDFANKEKNLEEFTQNGIDVASP